MSPCVVLHLRRCAQADGFTATHLGSWLGALGGPELAPTRLWPAAPLTAERAVAVVDAGVHLSDRNDVADDEIVILADGPAVPAPSALTRLAAAVQKAPDGVAVARPLPFDARAEGSDADGVRPDPGAVALTGEVLAALGGPADPASVLVRASEQGVAVRSCEIATVVTAPGRPAPAEPPSGIDAPYGHPAALGATPLHRLLVRLDLPIPSLPANRPPRPFLSVLTRTQGRRPQELEEALTCLTAQTTHDFELLVIAHRTTPAELSGVRELVARTPQWLQERTRVIEATREGRSSPLNDALDVARGRYVVVLDDDDTVLPHWVETFRGLEATTAGCVLRTACLRQDVTRAETADPIEPVAFARPVGPAYVGWPRAFSWLEHLDDNATPSLSVAFPRGVFADLGHRFDESLETTEDWEFLVRAVAVAGVTSSPEPTSVYRIWTDSDGSRHLHDEGVWRAARTRVLASLDGLSIILPAGAAADVRDLWGRIHTQDDALESTTHARDLAHLRIDDMAVERETLVAALDDLREAHDRAVAWRDSSLARAEKAEAKLVELRERLTRKNARIQDLEAEQTRTDSDRTRGRR